MGFSALLDIAGSFIIGGMLLLMLLRMNDFAVEKTYVQNSDRIVQRNLVNVVEFIERDFRKIGYCANWTKIPDPSKAIVSADSNSISFQTDIESDGTVDTINYDLQPLSSLDYTQNPRDRFLFREINGNVETKLNVTEFSLIYFNALGDTIDFPVNVPGEIYTMQINVAVENPNAYDEKYSNAFWRQIRLAARNLGNR
jgi:hypothetical protein